MLQEKRIVIIGGTSGIGLSAAQAFVAAGAKVVVVGKDHESCKKARELLGPSGRAWMGNASEAHISMAAIEKCEHEFGGFNALYHVAGGSGRSMGDGPLHEMSIDGWQYTMQLNLTSVMYSNRAAIQAFLKRGQPGAILNLASVLAWSPSVHHFTTHAYATAKSAIIGLSRSIAAYYAPNHIRVNVLAPGLVDTPMAKRAATDPEILHFMRTKQPLDGGRIGKASDLDAAAIYFLSDAASFATGQVLAVDGGWSLSEGQRNPHPST